MKEAFGIDLADGFVADEWERACRIFQKRHLLAHKMGVVDREYIERANDPEAAVGRKNSIQRDEVTSAIVEALGQRLFEGVLAPET